MIIKWAKSYQPPPPPEKKRIKRGYAVLNSDDISGKKYWVSFDGKGEDKLPFDYGKPLTFDPKQFEPGLCIELYTEVEDGFPTV